MTAPAPLTQRLDPTFELNSRPRGLVAGLSSSRVSAARPETFRDVLSRDLTSL